MRDAVVVSIIALGVMGGGIAGGAGPASAVSYMFTTFDVPGSNLGTTYARGINNAGQLTGQYRDGAVTRSFVDAGGVFTTFGVPNPLPPIGSAGTTLAAYGINDAGQTVGIEFNGNVNAAGFLDTGGTLSGVNVPGASQTTPQGINNAGQIVGSYLTTGFTGYGFEDTGGVFSTINVPNSGRTFAEGISNNGLVAGYYFDSTNLSHGFVDSNGSFGTINVPGAVITQAYGVNDAGTVVGFYQNSSGPFGFAETSAGDLTTLSVPGSTYTQAVGINDAGVVSGFYYDGTNSVTGNPLAHGFVATPVAAAVPEPASAAMLGFGLAVLGAGAQRRRRAA